MTNEPPVIPSESPNNSEDDQDIANQWSFWRKIRYFQEFYLQLIGPYTVYNAWPLVVTYLCSMYWNAAFVFHLKQYFTNKKDCTKFLTKWFFINMQSIDLRTNMQEINEFPYSFLWIGNLRNKFQHNLRLKIMLWNPFNIFYLCK